MKRLLNVCSIFILFLILLTGFGAADCFAVGETSRENHLLMTDVTESAVYVTVDGGYNVRTHILRISDDAAVEFKASYGGYYGDHTTARERREKAANWDDAWTFESVRAQAHDYTESADTEGEVIAASNGDFFDVDSGEPEGSLVIEGNILRRSNKRPYFAVLKNGRTVIRRAGKNLKDTSEVISGDVLLLRNGEIDVDRDEERKPREAIGICNDGTIVIISVDGREPASAGVTLYELASIMKAQNCRTALNLDGGGSTSLMTKRSDDEELVFRSNHSDGPERNVGSTLLIIKKSDENNAVLSEPDTVSMKNRQTRLIKDSKGVYRYRINGKGQTGFFSISGESYLFSKGKGLTADVKIGKTTYRFVKGKLDRSSDKKAGTVIIGYCGASKSGRNLIYAYHDGDKRLNIGINPRSKKKNGKMRDWDSSTVLEIPWYAVRADIERVYIGNGVENAGDYFLYSTRGHMVGGAAAPDCRLKKIRLPSSLRTVGDFSFFNKPELESISIPCNVEKIGKKAFAYSGTGTICFKGNTPPSFGKYALKKTGLSTAYVKSSKDWKKFVKEKRFKKYGFKRTVKYR